MGMRWFRLRLGTLTYEDWLLFCFVSGIFCGTAAALVFGGPTVQGCILGAAGSFGGGNRGDRQACRSAGGRQPGASRWKRRRFGGWIGSGSGGKQRRFVHGG